MLGVRFALCLVLLLSDVHLLVPAATTKGRMYSRPAEETVGISSNNMMVRGATTLYPVTSIYTSWFNEAPPAPTPAPTAAPTAAPTTEWSTIQVVGGTQAGEKYLSTTPQGAEINLWSSEDASGRQRWIITKGDGDWYTIQVSDGVSNERKYLSCHQSNDNVDLWLSDDGSGRQRWVIKKDATGDSYNIQILEGINQDKSYLRSKPNGKVQMVQEDDGSGQARWTISNFEALTPPVYDYDDACRRPASDIGNNRQWDYQGRTYASLDAVKPAEGSDGRQSGWYALPVGWSLAPAVWESKWAIRKKKWGSDFMALANGDSFWTFGNGDNSGKRKHTEIALAAQNTQGQTVSINDPSICKYKPSPNVAGDMRILIVKNR